MSPYKTALNCCESSSNSPNEHTCEGNTKVHKRFVYSAGPLFAHHLEPAWKQLLIFHCSKQNNTAKTMIIGANGIELEYNQMQRDIYTYKKVSSVGLSSLGTNEAQNILKGLNWGQAVVCLFCFKMFGQSYMKEEMLPRKLSSIFSNLRSMMDP